jgi:DNA-binding Lrp family transcriptional regulator
MENKTENKIPKSSETESEIIDYLQNNGVASEEEIAQALNLHIIDVIDALLELEKKGIALRVDEVLLIGN